MNKTTITVGSVTYAIKLRKLLIKAGIGSRLVKVDNTSLNKGCSHGVEILDSDFYQAIVIMKDNGIEYSVYNKQ